MAARLKPDYKIRKEFHSTFDPLKHNSHHAPFSPLYRPGQEQRMDRMYKAADPSRDPYIPSSPIRDDFRNADDAFQHVADDESPRLTNRVDPRYGSAKGRQEMPSSPFSNAAPGRESKLSLDMDEIQQQRPYNSRDREEYFKFRNRNSPRGGDQDRPALNGVAGLGSYTDRTEPRKHHQVDSFEKPWANKRYGSADRMIDPRTGSMGYNDLPGPSRLRHGGALLFIRFPTGSGPGRCENIAVASQAFLRSKTHDMGGKFLGMARSVQDYGYPSGPREAIGVYHFPSPEKALLFFQYDMTIRQPDFPPPYGHAEMWIVSNAYLPDNLDTYDTFLLSEIMLHDGRDKREFFEVFQKPFEGYLSSNGVMPFVICSYGPHDRQSLRRHAYNHRTIVTCHLFQGLEHLRWLSDEEMYLKYRNLHNQMAEEKCMVFTLDRNLCP